MKLECVRDKIKEAVGLAEKISGKNLNLPILSAVLLEAVNDTLVVKATNLEVGIEIKIPVKTDKNGLIAVNANTLANYLNNLTKEDKIFLEGDKDNLKLKSESTNTVIKSLPADDFPLIPKIDLKDEKTNSFEINAQDFNNGLKAVFFAASVSDIKPEISSVYLYQQDQNLIFAATDSFRLAEKKINIPSFIKDLNINLIIPFKNITELIKVLENLNEKITVIFNKNQLVVKTDKIYLTLRVIDGVYPDYRQIIPKQFKTEFNIKKEELTNLLKLSTIFSDRFNQINLTLLPEKNTLELTSFNQEVGENKSTLLIKIDGEPMNISFNAKYLIDCLNSIEEPTIKMKLTDLNKPLIISGLNDQSFIYLAMPINK